MPTFRAFCKSDVVSRLGMSAPLTRSRGDNTMHSSEISYSHWQGMTAVLPPVAPGSEAIAAGIVAKLARFPVPVADLEAVQ